MVTTLKGCKTLGHNGTDAIGTVSGGGTVAGYWITDSNITMIQNALSGVTGMLFLLFFLFLFLVAHVGI
jgi:hypothetical protein